MSGWNGAEIDQLVGRLSAAGLGPVDPTPAQLKALLKADPPGPLQFVNLLGFHQQAQYPEGHELAGAGLTGAEAYARYGAVALDQVTRRGGQLALYNDVALVLIGTEGWDQVAVVTYPSTATFVDMISDPGYQAALVHRDAGLARTALLVTRSALPG
jgi:uncharacterized protein (DUF1330 family)